MLYIRHRRPHRFTGAVAARRDWQVVVPVPAGATAVKWSFNVTGGYDVDFSVFFCPDVTGGEGGGAEEEEDVAVVEGGRMAGQHLFKPAQAVLFL